MSNTTTHEVPFATPVDLAEAPHPFENGAWLHWIANERPAFDQEAAEARGQESSERERHHWNKREESFQRCDTDGFVSQWADGLSAQEARRQARIDRNGGFEIFPGLYHRESGKRVRAKLIDGKYGACWAFCDAEGNFTGRFIGDSRTRRAKLYKEGFVVLGEWAPAKATLKGSGTGLSGTAWAATVRTDGGYPDEAVVM